MKFTAKKHSSSAYRPPLSILLPQRCSWHPPLGWPSTTSVQTVRGPFAMRATPTTITLEA